MTKQKKKTSGKDLGMKIFLSLTAILLVVVLCTSALGSTGILLRSSTPLSSANFEVDGAMLTYFYRTSYFSLASSLGENLSYFLDTSKPLKSQQFVDGTQTWHDYLLTSATAQAKEMLVLAEAAKAAGMMIGAEDQETIDDNIAALAESATAYNYPSLDFFIAAQYGEGIKEKDIRHALELSVLASKYSTKIQDDIVITDAEVDTYFTEHAADYTYVDLRQYTFSAGDAEIEGVTEEQKNEKKAELKKHADALAATKTTAEFDAYLSQYMKDVTAATATGEITEDNIQANLDQTVYAGYSARDTEQGKWAFDTARKVGDTTIIEDAEKSSYTVVMLEKALYRDEDASRNVRHILLRTENYENAAAAKAIADKVLAEYEAGAKTEDAFAALANQYSEDPGSNTKGGIYENVMPGEMVTEFNDWLFDDTRKAGDVAVVEAEDTGAHVMYYVGEGQPKWEVQVRNAMTSERYEAAYKALEESTSIKESAGALKRIG